VQFATTNYDKLIEAVTKLPSVTWMQKERVERVIRGDEKGVLHLHGSFDQPESVVLSLRSYEEVLHDQHAQNTLRTLHTMRTFLFVGCGAGLNDPNLGALLKWTGSTLTHAYRRFRLALEREVDQLQKEHPPGQNIFVLPFGKEHRDLAPFLRRFKAPAAAPVGITNPLSRLAAYPFPRVRNADCFDLLGVAMSEHVKRNRTPPERPPYIPRSSDPPLHEAFLKNGFVILTGELSAGKTRSAYELLLNSTPDDEIVVPKDPSALAALIENLQEARAAVILWLDDFKRYLKADASTVTAIFEAYRSHMRLVATMSHEDWRELNGETKLTRDIKRLLERAERIPIDVKMQPHEEQDARRLYPRQIFNQAIGESMIAGPELKQRFEEGEHWLQAVVRAVHECRRTGLSSPISTKDLFPLFKKFLEELPPQPAANESAADGLFHQALRLAIKPVRTYSALLHSAKDGYTISPYIHEYLTKSDPPKVLKPAWELACRSIASALEALDVALCASSHVEDDFVVEAFQAGVKLGSGRCAYGLGLLQYQKGAYEKAEEAFREALRLKHDTAEVYFDLAATLYGQNRVQEAVPEYRKAIERDPGNTEQRLVLANLLFSLGKYQEAKEEFLKVIDLRPKDASLHVSVAECNFLIGMETEAENEYGEAIRIDGKYAKAHYGLAELL
jgi:tetratricopeptide (TPR) repeat protein